ncbi:MAG TPA: MBL fold metallo-hydrolase [Synergistales bacterium]|nr:MBL fold metallo-hydrolase [Synergistales bacterium]
MDPWEKWFIVKEVTKGLFAISEPYHRMQVRSYLLAGKDRALLIDTGLGICDISLPVRKLTPLPVSVITTHSHWDHIGGHDLFQEVMVHELDAPWLAEGLPITLGETREMLLKGLKSSIPYPGFDPSEYVSPTVGDPLILHDGEYIKNGKHSLRVIHTPGHSPGGISLFEEKEGVLFTGDTFYRSRIFAHFPTTNPSNLLDSILKLAELQPRLICPGHFHDSLCPFLLEEGAELARWLRDQGLDRHGSGLHSSRNISFLF